MHVYRCDLTLHDYLFFATTERGKVAETGPFIHNYALTYALGWAKGPLHNEIQKPRYREELGQVGKRYVTPARLIQGSYVVNQYNTLGESYAFDKARSIGYPDWGFIKCFRPGSTFRCYVISAEVVRFPHYLRLGKFMAKTLLETQRATQLDVQNHPLEKSEIRGQTVSSSLLTWNDLITTARPAIYDIIMNALPSRLIDHPRFDGVPGKYLVAKFEQSSDILQFPMHMGYYGENLCVSW